MTAKRPFEGIRVLDVSRILASPLAGAQLAFLGADVIKIEDPGVGDPGRIYPSNSKKLMASGMSSQFLSQNANKRSLTLNLRTREGQDIFRRLAQDSDVIIENLRTGTMARYGLAYDDIRKINARIVYCSVTAYGNCGPKRRHPAYDPVLQAASGMMSVNGTPETVPLKIGPPVIDYGAGLTAAFAIVTALFQRVQTGEGQHIDVSMLDTAFVLMGSVVTDVLTTGAVPRPHGNSFASMATNACYKTKDGLLYIAAMQEHQVAHLFDCLGRSDLGNDARYATSELRSVNGAALRTEIETAFTRKTAAEWEVILNEAGVPGMRVRTIPEAVADPQLNNRGLFRSFAEVPGVNGRVTVPLVPFRLSTCEARADIPPPTLGAHTLEILQSLGFTASEIDGLRVRHVI